MRRKRRSRGTWLPMLGSVSSTETNNSLDIYMDIEVPVDGSPIFGLLPVLADLEPDPGAGADNRYVFTDPDILLKRVLGSIFVNYGDVNVEDNVQTAAIKVNAAFFVARKGDTGSGADVGPVGYFTNSLAQNLREYSPDRQETSRQPWMWKREWILGFPNSAQTIAGTHLVGAWGYPSNNSLYGDVRSGPFIDIKTRRRIRQDERLFLIVEARNYPPRNVTIDRDVTPTSTAHVEVACSVRAFGSFIKPHNRSAF